MNVEPQIVECPRCNSPVAWEEFGEHIEQHISAAVHIASQRITAEPGEVWNEGVETAPAACTLLATYFNPIYGEWIVQLFVADKPKAPFTHWQYVTRPGEALAEKE